MKINTPFSKDNPFIDYKVKENLISNDKGNIPLIYWPVTPNFGDLLSPWLFEKITSRKVDLVKTHIRKYKGLREFIKNLTSKNTANKTPNYISIGSIISRVQNLSEVWGTGSFGVEPPITFNNKANYKAVRGPLTKQLLEYNGIKCPSVFGDPALLTPFLYNPKIEKTHEIGLVLRWSEKKWLQKKAGDNIKIIDLGESNVENTLNQILSCKKIITSSLHGLIIADAYKIPNAWLASQSPKGGTFKYYDYFLSVDKVRHPTVFDIESKELNIDTLNESFNFDDRKISIDLRKLLDACPLITKQ